VIKQIILNGAAENGYPTLNDINEDRIGFGLAQGILKNGERYSAAKAYLSPIKSRLNLKVIKRAVVTKLIINTKTNRVEGVNYVLKGRTLKVLARNEVILSAGTFESPKLLMLSGIGRAEDLSPFKIKQIVDLPVGRNLQDHVHTSVNFQFLKAVAMDDNPLDTFDAAYLYLRKRQGPFTGSGCVNILGFIDTKNKMATTDPDVEYLHQCFPKGFQGFKTALENFGMSSFIISQLIELNKETPILSNSMILLRPKSTGTVKLKSKNYRDNPVINLNYFADDEDVKTLIRAIREYRKLLDTQSFRAFAIHDLRYSLPECDVNMFDSDDYWRCYISYFSSTMYHPVGTVKMAEENDPSGVVGPNLKVKGLKGLRVVDASIMPNVISGHTMAAVQMIAEKISDNIKAEWT
jgi:choline dehydrogenase-like flavoprotein